MIHPARVSEEITITREQFDEACNGAWETYEKTRQWLSQRWSFPQCVPADQGAWPRYLLLLLDKIEGSPRQELLRQLQECFSLPMRIGFDLLDEMRPFTDGLQALHGVWVGWSSDAGEEFQTRIGNEVFSVKPLFIPAWKGGDDFQDFTVVREMIYARTRILSEFRMAGFFESTTNKELERRRDGILGEIHAALGPPLMDIREKLIWATPSGGLVIVEVMFATGDGVFELHVTISLRRRLMRPRHDNFYNELMEEMIVKKAKQNQQTLVEEGERHRD